jgi:hypothetical protein
MCVYLNSVMVEVYIESYQVILAFVYLIPV